MLRHYAKWNESDTKAHIRFHLHEAPNTDKYTETESRIGVARG